MFCLSYEIIIEFILLLVLKMKSKKMHNKEKKVELLKGFKMFDNNKINFKNSFKIKLELLKLKIYIINNIKKWI